MTTKKQNQIPEGLVYYYNNENNKVQSINFGSEYIYDFNIETNTLNVEKNIHYLPFFYNEAGSKVIQNLSLIVGRNGSGKTRLINDIIEGVAIFGLHLKPTSLMIFRNKNTFNIYTFNSDEIKIVGNEYNYTFTINQEVKQKLFKGLQEKVTTVIVSNVFNPFQYASKSFETIDLSTTEIIKRVNLKKSRLYSSVLNNSKKNTSFEKEEMDNILKYYSSDFFLELFSVEFPLVLTRNNGYLLLELKELYQKIITEDFKTQFMESFEKDLVFKIDRSERTDNSHEDIKEVNNFIQSVFKVVYRSLNDKELDSIEFYNQYAKLKVEALYNEICIKLNNLIIYFDDLYNSKDDKLLDKRQNDCFLYVLDLYMIYILNANHYSVITKKEYCMLPVLLIPEIDFFQEKSVSVFIEESKTILSDLFFTQIDDYIELIKSAERDRFINAQGKALVFTDKTRYREIYTIWNNSTSDFIKKYTWLEFKGMSSGQFALLTLFSRIYNIKDSDKVKDKELILLLIDEADLYLHPQWQKQLISKFIRFCSIVFQDKKVQIIMTTNSAIPVSDVLKYNVVLLGDDSKKHLDNYRNTFGGNIFNLLNDTFFIQDGFIGDFAQMKIQDLIDILYDKEIEFLIEHMDDIENRINLIGEELIKNKLLEILEQRLSANLLSIKHTLSRLEKRLNTLEKKAEK